MVSFFKKKSSTPSTPTTPTSVVSTKDEKHVDNRQSTFLQRPSTSRTPNSTAQGPNIAELVKRVPVPAAPNPHEDPSGYLRSIHAVRERSRLVSDKVKTDGLKHFRVEKEKVEETADYVAAIIKVRLDKQTKTSSKSLPDTERLRAGLFIHPATRTMAAFRGWGRAALEEDDGLLGTES